MSPNPSALAMPSCGVPDAGVSVNRLSPFGCNPALLMKRVRPIWPTVVGVVEPGNVTVTCPCALMVRPEEFCGIVMVGCTGLPCAVTTRPCASIWNEPSRV
jgi:hypothetical protein